MWKRYRWQFPPENETCTCWFVANFDSEDQTVPAKLICRSLACIRMELCTVRLATSQNIRQEWDKRLENNSMAVDRIQENRDLWLHAGGCDPEVLYTPTELHLEVVARTVSTLNAMLEKYGPRGGLDSFVEGIQNATKMLKVVSLILSCRVLVYMVVRACARLHACNFGAQRLGCHQKRSLQSYTKSPLRRARPQHGANHLQVGR